MGWDARRWHGIGGGWHGWLVGWQWQWLQVVGMAGGWSGSSSNLDGIARHGTAWHGMAWHGMAAVVVAGLSAAGCLVVAAPYLVCNYNYNNYYLILILFYFIALGELN